MWRRLSSSSARQRASTPRSSTTLPCQSAPRSVQSLPSTWLLPAQRTRWRQNQHSKVVERRCVPPGDSCHMSCVSHSCCTDPASPSPLRPQHCAAQALVDGPDEFMAAAERGLRALALTVAENSLTEPADFAFVPVVLDFPVLLKYAQLCMRMCVCVCVCVCVCSVFMWPCSLLAGTQSWTSCHNGWCAGAVSRIPSR